MDTWLLLTFFNLFVLSLLALDLGIFNRRDHVIELREALITSAFYILSAVVFGIGIYHFQGSQSGLEFFTGYLIEKSLSLDNLFVISMIFTHFGVERQQQHRILYWGVLGALVMRGLMIAVGSLLITKFHWIIYVFGGFLLYTGVNMMRTIDHEITIEHHPLIQWLKTRFPKLSPFLIVLIMVEVMDFIFAVDSIPAIFAVTTDPFIVYTSNVFALLGLRSLYFAMAAVLHKFAYLKYGLALVMIFIGAKMLLSHYIAVPTGISLSITILLITGSGVISWLKPPQQ